LKWFTRIVIFLFFIPVQTLLLEPLKMGGVKPDLALLLAFMHGWAFGEMNGLFWGLALGGLLDLFSIGFLGINFVLKGIIGLFAGIFGKTLINLPIWGNGLIIFFISYLHDLIGTLLLRGSEENGFTMVIMGRIFVRALYNGLLATVLFYAFLRIKNRGGMSKYAGASSPPG
jgi:rod shape-determining protein MreD